MDNREQILNCALDLFYSRGYDAVGVQEIADQAGITKPTLYYYFGSKLGLLKNLLQEGTESLRVNLSKIVYQGDIPDTLYKVAEVFLNFGTENRKMYCLMLALFYSARENETYQVVRPLILSHYKHILQIFDDAKSELGNMHGRQQQFAIGFTGVLNHYLLMKYELQSHNTVTTEEIHQVVRQFMYGIYT